MNKLENILIEVEKNPYRVIDVIDLNTGLYIEKKLNGETASTKYGGLNAFFKSLMQSGKNKLRIIYRSQNGTTKSGSKQYRKRDDFKINIASNNNEVKIIETMQNLEKTPSQTTLNLTPIEQSLGGTFNAANVLGLNGMDILRSFTAEDRLKQLTEDHSKLRHDALKLELESKAKDKEILDLEKKLMRQEIEAERNQKSSIEAFTPLINAFAPHLVSLAETKINKKQIPDKTNALAGIIDNLPTNAKEIIGLVADQKLNEETAFAMNALFKGFSIAEFKTKYFELLQEFKIIE